MEGWEQVELLGHRSFFFRYENGLIEISQIREELNYQSNKIKKMAFSLPLKDTVEEMGDLVKKSLHTKFTWSNDAIYGAVQAILIHLFPDPEYKEVIDSYLEDQLIC